MSSNRRNKYRQVFCQKQVKNAYFFDPLNNGYGIRLIPEELSLQDKNRHDASLERISG
jgi:hypothetical protein